MTHRVKLIAFMIMATLTVTAQKEFTLEDLNFGGKNYRNMIPENRQVTWWGDELIHLEKETCFTVNKNNCKETVLVSLKEINSITGGNEKEIKSLLRATFPYAKKSIVKLANSKYVMLIDWKKKQIISQTDRENVMAEEWAASSQAFAYVKDNQLYVTDDKTEQQLTNDGSREIVYGQSVHRNEFGINKGLFWNPNGTQLAFYRMDQSMVADYPQVNIDTPIASYEPDKYPMAGETSHHVTIGIYNTKTNKTIYLETGEPADHYLTNIAWHPEKDIIYVFELNREQNDCRLNAYDTQTGKLIKELYREQSSKYVEPQHPIIFLAWDNSKFIMQSQRDGFNHLYLCEATTGNIIKQITKGHWMVSDILGFDNEKHNIIIVSNEESPIQQNIYSVNIDTEKRIRLDNGKGWHNGTLSSTGQWIVDNYSEPDVPRVITITNTRSQATKEWLKAKDPWIGYNVPEYSCGTIKADDGITDLYYRMVKPVNFDPNKKYPTIVYVYGGPHAHMVDARWHYSSRSWETYMAQRGYLLFILDNRGSERRGTAFEQATWHQLGEVEAADQMCGVNYLRTLPYVDTDRMGIHGWSFGGFMTINLMTKYPDIFKVGVAGGPVIDWKWYEVMYGERYMGTPKDNAEGYKKSSLLSRVNNLKGRLQIISGYNDPTVVPQHCLSFIRECTDAGVQCDFFVYPGEGHNMARHRSVHLHERITRYFDDFLK